MTLKSSFLSSVRPFFAPEDEGKSAAQLEREKVVINTPKPAPSDEAKEDDNNKEVEEGDDKAKDDSGNDDKSDDKSDASDTDGDASGDDNSGDADGEEQEEEAEASPEDLKKEVAKLSKQIERMQKRVGKTQGERDTIKRELAEAKAALEAKVKEGEQPLTEEEVNRRAKAIAAQEVSANEFRRIERKLIKDAEKLDPKFMNKVVDMADDIGPIPPFIIEALDDLDNDNGGAILNHYANNPDDYEEVFNMIAERQSPVKVLNKINKLSDKLAEAAKPKKKAISKVPPPPPAPKGNSKNPDQLPIDPTKNMDEYVRIRNQQDAEKRRAGR